MRHVVKAMHKWCGSDEHPFVKIENDFDIPGVAPIVSFTVQSDPIKEVGVNGVQATDMLVYVKCLFESLNEAFPCRENQLTIDMLEVAKFWQDKRTADRIARQVEGENKL